MNTALKCTCGDSTEIPTGHKIMCHKCRKVYSLDYLINDNKPIVVEPAPFKSKCWTCSKATNCEDANGDTIDCAVYSNNKLVAEDTIVMEEVIVNSRDFNIGNSDYAKHKIQPWDIWLEYKLNPWDADIVKRVLRTKEGESRVLDYEKIIHICQERIRQLK